MEAITNRVSFRRGLQKQKAQAWREKVFTSNFWMSGLGYPAKYIPRSFRVKQVDGMAFFTDAKHDEFRNRILRVTVVETLASGER